MRAVSFIDKALCISCNGMVHLLEVVVLATDSGQRWSCFDISKEHYLDDGAK